MRVRLGIVALVSALAGTASVAQSLSYQHKREIFFPIPTDRLTNLNPQPTKLRLWYAAPGQKWKLGSEKALNNLDTNSNGQRGFRFAATDDGEYEFATQQVYADGGESPRESALRADFRVIFDSKPPTVNATVTGNTGIEWDVRDENLEVDSVRIEARYKDTNQKFTPVKDKQRAQDRYTWSSIPAGYILEVRVVGRDKAGNEANSRILTLPSNGVAGNIDRGSGGRRNDDTPLKSATSFGDDFPNRPEIQYVNDSTFNVESKITRVTKSGVGKVVLWVRDEKSDWKEFTQQDTVIRADEKDPMVRIPYTATVDGLYEFRVMPISNANLARGDKIEKPNKSEPAQIMVEVDKTKPEVTIRNVKVSAGGTGLPRVDIDYLAKDRNLIAENPVTLEWSNNQVTWNIITRTKRDGVFTWDNIPENEWKIFIRARAQDKAANEGSASWPNAVIIDLDRPEATIERIERTGGSRPPETSGPETRSIPNIAPGGGTPVGGSGSNLLTPPGLTTGGKN